MATDPAAASPAPCAPVVFLVFNRPELTRLVLAAIRAARPARLLIVADGPRDDVPGEAETCAQVRREVLAGVDWPCRVQTEFAGRNLGCGRRIFSGLHWAFGEVEEAIILEDDCRPEPTFFRFCTELLARHRDDARVAMIAGTNFRGARPAEADRCLFTRHCSVWGWATWRRALQGYRLDLDWWRTSVQPRDLRGECRDAREHRLVCAWLDAQRRGTVDTWDVQWFAHVFRQGGLSVVSGTNLISNLGVVGHHSTGSTRTHGLSTSPARFPLISPATHERDAAYERFLVDRPRPWGGWILGPWVARLLRGPLGPTLRRAWRTTGALRRRGARENPTSLP
jgi:hypothetical protein